MYDHDEFANIFHFLNLPCVFAREYDPEAIAKLLLEIASLVYVPPTLLPVIRAIKMIFEEQEERYQSWRKNALYMCETIVVERMKDYKSTNLPTDGNALELQPLCPGVYVLEISVRRDDYRTDRIPVIVYHNTTIRDIRWALFESEVWRLLEDLNALEVYNKLMDDESAAPPVGSSVPDKQMCVTGELLVNGHVINVAEDVKAWQLKLYGKHVEASMLYKLHLVTSR